MKASLHSLAVVVLLAGLLPTPQSLGQAKSAPSVDRQSLRSLTEAAYQQAFNRWAPKGYWPTKIDVRIVDRQPRFDIDFEKNLEGTPYQARHGLSATKFMQLDKQFAQQGYRIAIRKSYNSGNAQRLLGVWTLSVKSQPLGQIWKSANEIPITGRASSKTQPLDDMLRSFLLQHQIPGATLAVSFRGKMVYQRGFGFSDLEQRVAMNPDTQMRIASISKSITGAAILRLVDQGKLALDDKVFKKLDLGLSPQSSPVDLRIHDITVLHLLRHTGGWDRDVSFDPMFRQPAIARTMKLPLPVEPQDIIRYMLTQPLDHDPGTLYAYSNFGYSVLGRLIEKVTGQTYESYVRDEVLKPLKIRQMKIGKTLLEQRSLNETRYYTRDGKRFASLFHPERQVPAPYGRWYLESFDAHGGWLASAPELVRFANAFDQPDVCPLMSESAVKLMFNPPHPEPFDAQGQSRFYACGWSIVSFNRGRQFNAYHSGLLAGTSTLLVRRHDGYNWAILFNIDRTADGRVAASLIDGLIHQAVDQSHRRQ